MGISHPLIGRETWGHSKIGNLYKSVTISVHGVIVRATENHPRILWRELQCCCWNNYSLLCGIKTSQDQ